MFPHHRAQSGALCYLARVWRSALALAFLIAGGCERTASCDALAQHVGLVVEHEDAELTRRAQSPDSKFLPRFGDYAQQIRDKCEAGKLTDEVKRCFVAAHNGAGIDRCGAAVE
jgi:hypothetical protein